jgi:hypothetical protein
MWHSPMITTRGGRYVPHRCRIIVILRTPSLPEQLQDGRWSTGTVRRYARTRDPAVQRPRAARSAAVRSRPTSDPAVERDIAGAPSTPCETPRPHPGRTIGHPLRFTRSLPTSSPLPCTYRLSVPLETSRAHMQRDPTRLERRALDLSPQLSEDTSARPMQATASCRTSARVSVRTTCVHVSDTPRNHPFHTISPIHLTDI